LALAEFEGDKQSLLRILRSAHGRGGKNGEFDENKSWRHLFALAEDYFWDVRAKRHATPYAKRFKQLNDITRALGRARVMIEKAMQTDVGEDLLWAWWGDPVEYDPMGPFTSMPDKNLLVKELAKIEDLENAALEAANEIPLRQGRPPGTAILPWRHIEAVAGVYSECTGKQPKASGQFADFVIKFLNAVGRPDALEYESVIDAIKNARALSRSAAIKYGRESPFGL
jgi:hypothetical protein